MSVHSSLQLGLLMMCSGNGAACHYVLVLTPFLITRISQILQLFLYLAMYVVIAIREDVESVYLLKIHIYFCVVELLRSTVSRIALQHTRSEIMKTRMFSE